MWVSNLHYMVQWFCNLKTIWWINVVLEILIQCDTNIELKLYVGQWPILHGPVILPYILKTIWWNIGSMWCKDLPQKNAWSVTYISWSSDFVLHLEDYDGLMLYWEMKIQCDTNIELKLYMSTSDLYFMVQRFCLISWRLFDGTNAIIGILDPGDAD